MKKSKRPVEKYLIGLAHFFKIVFRLLWSPFVGAWKECEADLNNRPRARNVKEFFLFSLKSYFSPLTGAIAGVKKEFKRCFGSVHGAK